MRTEQEARFDDDVPPVCRVKGLAHASARLHPPSTGPNGWRKIQEPSNGPYPQRPSHANVPQDSSAPLLRQKANQISTF